MKTDIVIGVKVKKSTLFKLALEESKEFYTIVEQYIAEEKNNTFNKFEKRMMSVLKHFIVNVKIFPFDLESYVVGKPLTAEYGGNGSYMLSYIS